MFPIHRRRELQPLRSTPRAPPRARPATRADSLRSKWRRGSWLRHLRSGVVAVRVDVEGALRAVHLQPHEIRSRLNRIDWDRLHGAVRRGDRRKAIAEWRIGREAIQRQDELLILFHR